MEFMSALMGMGFGDIAADLFKELDIDGSRLVAGAGQLGQWLLRHAPSAARRARHAAVAQRLHRALVPCLLGTPR